MIAKNFQRIKKELSEGTRIVAVSKKKPISDIIAAIEAGAKDIGENRMQEAQEKYELLKEILRKHQVKYHFIGHLQRNKVKEVVRFADLIQSVDSQTLAKEINKRAHHIEKVQDVLIQVNIGSEEQKYGCSKDELFSLLKQVSILKNIQVRGLMCITPYFEDAEETRPYFKQMRSLFKKVIKNPIPNIHMGYLSMGMTHDYRIAVDEGSNMVRIGTGIFGKRI